MRADDNPPFRFVFKTRASNEPYEKLSLSSMRQQCNHVQFGWIRRRDKFLVLTAARKTVGDRPLPDRSSHLSTARFLLPITSQHLANSHIRCSSPKGIDICNRAQHFLALQSYGNISECRGSYTPNPGNCVAVAASEGWVSLTRRSYW